MQYMGTNKIPAENKNLLWIQNSSSIKIEPSSETYPKHNPQDANIASKSLICSSDEKNNNNT